MQNKLEKLIKAVYKEWKRDRLPSQESHPDEETLVCFLENRLSPEQSHSIKEHLISCDGCAQVFALQLKLEPTEVKVVPQELVARVKNLVTSCKNTPVLEIFLQVKERLLEILNTTGDVLVGQELVPAPVLRSRQIKEFRDEVTILKNFEDIRVEIKIENKPGKTFNLIVLVKEKKTLKVIKDLRVTLIKDDIELESYLTDSGKVIFEHVLLGRYTVEISSVEKRLASILLDIKI